MIHVCISGSLGTGVDPGDRAEAEEQEKEEVRSVGVVFGGWDIAGCFAGGWLAGQSKDCSPGRLMSM